MIIIVSVTGNTKDIRVTDLNFLSKSTGNPEVVFDEPLAAGDPRNVQVKRTPIEDTDRGHIIFEARIQGSGSEYKTIRKYEFPSNNDPCQVADADLSQDRRTSHA